jgi:hypothetical protein
VEYDLENVDTLVKLLERFEMLGTTVCGGYDGVDYSEGRVDERWESQPYGYQLPNGNRFTWAFAEGTLDWVMKRYPFSPSP